MAETNLVFTFRDQTSGAIRSILAPNEGAARLWLAGIWTDEKRTPGHVWCAVEDLPKLLEKAEAMERSAHEAWLNANSIRKTRTAATEVLGQVNALAQRYRQAEGWVQELTRISTVARRYL